MTSIINKEKFFLDVFNNILDFNNSKVIVIFDTNGNTWFGLKDLLKMLGYNSIINQINVLKINEKFIKYFSDIKVPHTFVIPCNFQKNTKFINESGLYEVLTKSAKPLAKTFLTKYLTEIMPQIRKTGKYISNKNDMNKIKKLNNKIDNYKTELNYYNDKYQFVPSTHGYIYICEDNQIKNGIKIKCLKVGFDIDMEKRMREYKVGNFIHKLLAYIPLKIDRKQVESCVKNKLKTHLTKLTTDTICYLSLEELKKELIDCINTITNHICHCVKCSKTYNIDSLDKHKCNITTKKDIIDYQVNTKKNSKVKSKKNSKVKSKKNSKK
jgi:prophage antirepressor-like protein